jgi:hypothetical protein
MTKRRCVLCAAIAIVLLAGTSGRSQASDDLTLRVETGLGGAARPGRWTPVRVDVTNAGHDFSGEIVVEWGEVRVHRAFEIAAPSRSIVELSVRAHDARSSMVVSLVSNGHAIASADVPVRPVPDNERLIVCAGSSREVAADAGCSTVIAPESLPRSMRGYDSADEVHVVADIEQRLAPEQRAALRRWREYHELDAQDVLTQAPHAIQTGGSEAAVGWSTRIACLVVLCALVAAAGISLRVRGSALLTYASLVVATIVATIGAIVAGRVGPGSAVLVRHATSVQQIGDGSVISMRGTIEYPAFDAYAIHVRPADGALTHRSAPRAEEWTESDGTSIRRGTVGRGHHEEVEFEAVGDFAPFAVRVQGDTVRVSNVSSQPLTDCRFPEGFSHTDAGTLRPGDSSEARSSGMSPASFFSCAMSDAPVLVSDPRFPVRMIGSTIVSVRLPPRQTSGDEQ